MSTENFDRYKALERELYAVRVKHNDKESEEEDKLLDAMELIWWELTPSEQDAANSS